MAQKKGRPSESLIIEALGQVHGQPLEFWLLNMISNNFKKILGSPNKNQTHMICLQFAISNKIIMRNTLAFFSERLQECA